MGCLRPFFRAAYSAAKAGATAAKGLRWGDVYAELGAAGFGNPEQLGRYTERQLKLFHGRLTSQRQVRRAELIEDIASAYAGCKSQDGNQALIQRIEQLRTD